jgi:predicted dehydrogenase
MKKRNGSTRRRFLKTGAAVGAALWLTPAGTVLGANERIGIAVIGCGGKGGGHIKQLKGMKDVNIVALCDADKRRMEQHAKGIKGSVQQVQDLRRIFEMKDVDAVLIATPNHWHAPASIMASQAGKDSYVEKPVAHSIWEGRKMVEAARKYNRVVQGGTQQRSDAFYGQLRKDLQSGTFGAVKLVHCLKHNRRASIGKVTSPQQPPSSVDYNLWCGPAPKTPVMRKNFHYDWHWQWSWGNGEMGNWGPHVVDDLRNILGWDDVPESVIGAGGRFGWDDNGETPNMHIALFEHKGMKIVVDVRDLPDKKGSRSPGSYMRSRGHNVIICEGATIRVGRGGGGAYDSGGKKIKSYRGNSGREHISNWIGAIKARDPQKLNCEVEVGHQSTMMCLMANIAMRVGSTASLDQVKSAMSEHQDAVDTLEHMAAQLSANGVADTSMTLGPKLTFDTKREVFTGPHADEANKIVRQEMRSEFAVPDNV